MYVTAVSGLHPTNVLAPGVTVSLVRMSAASIRLKTRVANREAGEGALHSCLKDESAIMASIEYLCTEDHFTSLYIEFKVADGAEKARVVLGALGAVGVLFTEAGRPTARLQSSWSEALRRLSSSGLSRTHQARAWTSTICRGTGRC